MWLDLAGDGNFSADHVVQNPPSNDYHLLDGGGIFPNWQEYLDFLKTTMEQNTVSNVSGVLVPGHSAMMIFADYNGFPEGHLWKYLLSNQQCFMHIQILWCDWCSGNCMCPAWLLCAKCNGRSLQEWTTKKYRLCNSEGTPNPQHWSWPGGHVHVWYHVPVYHSPPGENQLCTAAWPPNWSCNWHVPCACSQGTMFLLIFSFFNSWCQCHFRGDCGIPWSALNGISPSTCIATLAHHSEVLDNHAYNSNHKKMIGMTKFLCCQHKNAILNLEEVEQYLAKLTNDADNLAIQQ